MYKKGISIIIPCYNVGHYIQETIGSIIGQNILNNYEIIVIDDGSSNKETKYYLEKIKKYDVVKVIELESNKGVQYARSLGLKIANYDYILCIDADDCLNTDVDILRKGTYIDRAIDVLEVHQDVAYVYCTTLMFEGYEGYTISAYKVDYTQILEKHHAPISIIYRREEALEAGLYDIRIKKWQDWSFAVALLNTRFKKQKANNIYYLEQPYYKYRIHNNTERISNLQHDELEMIKITISSNKEIFSNYFNSHDLNELANIVMSKKPSRLIDLLHIANYNIETALKMAKEREYKLVTKLPIENLP